MKNAIEKILSLDPSSMAIGYAVFDGMRLAEHGRITPNKASAPALARVRSMRLQLLELLREQKPDGIIVEAMIDRQHTRYPGRTTALPLCGWAMGVIYGTCLSYAGNLMDNFPRCTVFAISNAWCRRIKKSERALVTRVQFPAYDPSKDPGGDMADSISMGMWWISQQARKELLAKVTS